MTPAACIFGWSEKLPITMPIRGSPSPSALAISLPSPCQMSHRVGPRGLRALPWADVRPVPHALERNCSEAIVCPPAGHLVVIAQSGDREDPAPGGDHLAIRADRRSGLEDRQARHAGDFAQPPDG